MSLLELSSFSTESAVKGKSALPQEMTQRVHDVK